MQSGRRRVRQESKFEAVLRRRGGNALLCKVKRESKFLPGSVARLDQPIRASIHSSGFPPASRSRAVIFNLPPSIATGSTLSPPPK